MVKIILTNKEYELLLFTMGLYSEHVMNTDKELAKRVLALSMSIVAKRETFPAIPKAKKAKQ